ncbi:hypothetical protein NDU88_000146 [Pleurodeles waltl]|uniref:Uncharacterized protein n=1 Tax=Pleurodeles waltl TaxID=8319 RepID=A0AAV7SWC6_PLEWA|nr:hypothetical protein NDU88_000146 [Pleurodeles waltl]
MKHRRPVGGASGEGPPVPAQLLSAYKAAPSRLRGSLREERWAPEQQIGLYPELSRGVSRMWTGTLPALLASLLTSALASRFLDAKWEAWKTKYGRAYTTPEEELVRRERWQTNWKMVVDHNKQADLANRTYRMALNHFADRTRSELESMSCLKIPTIKPKSVSKRWSAHTLPAHVDWRDENCVTSVKDQGNCGSCWAFAAVGALESRYCIKTQELIEMSEQELVDCDGTDDGCCGGFPYFAFRYLSDHGIMAASDYKYKARLGECRLKNNKAIAMNMSKFYAMDGEENMAAAVATDGPVTVGFAVTMNFFFYSEGIYDDECDVPPNHAIILIGYGTEDHEDYWIIKNSWGVDWGEEGFGKIRRNANVCTIGQIGSSMDLL